MHWCSPAARPRRLVASVVWLALSLQVSLAAAVTSTPITGEIQQITVDDPTDTWSSGSIIVGGQRVIVPRNLLIDLPANRLSLQQLLVEAPARCAALGETGLAREDRCGEGEHGAYVTLLANRSDAGNVIAGEIFLQKSVEALSGVVTFVDTTDGYLRLSGNVGDPTTGTLVRINDPSSRFTIQQGLGCAGTDNCSADARFGVDPDNYTVTFSTGYPACIPSRVATPERTSVADESGIGDALCPATNRGVTPVLDASRFAPIAVGDPVSVEGNFERVDNVRFFSAHTLTVGRALTTALGQPDFMIFDETGWDVPAFENQRLRVLFILFTTLGDSQLDIFGLHFDPNTGEGHEVPVASTVGNPDTINQGIGATAAGIAKIRFDVDFVEGAPVRPGLSPCENLGNAGLGTCRAGANLTQEFSVVSPVAREVIARSRNRQLNPDLQVFDIHGAAAPWGEYLTPVALVHPEFGEINLDALNTPMVFDGIPWNLDRRLSPGGCDGPCETTPQPLTPFPFSGVDPASEATLPPGAAARIFAFFPFGAADRLAWPPPEPASIPLVPIPDAAAVCSPIPALPPQPGPRIVPIGSTSSGVLRDRIPRSAPDPFEAGVPFLDVGAAALNANDRGALADPSLAGQADGELASTLEEASASAPVDLVLSVRMPAVLPPIGIPSALDVLIFNRGPGDLGTPARLVLVVPEGTRTTLNPEWQTLDGEACNDRAAGTPCVLALPPIASGERLSVSFGFRLEQVLPLDFRAIVLAARIEGLIDDPTPEDDEILASLSFGALPDRASLFGFEVPLASNLGDFIKDERAARQLGKLLFWEMQVGSDNVQACASCHFNAGADSRSDNQLNPGRPAGADVAFGFGGPGARLSAADFPFHALSNPRDRESPVLRSHDEVTSSQGVERRAFRGVRPGEADASESLPDPVFNIDGVNIRRAEPRNAPTTINAAYNDRNFWDGRAQNVFNGVSPFGVRDESARVLARRELEDTDVDPDAVARGYAIDSVSVAIEHSSLASQAVGPPVSSFEMSFDGRTWPDIGKKLLARDRPLAGQRIHPEDSLLAQYSAWPATGASTTYAELVRKAFAERWWNADVIVDVSGSVPSISNAPPGLVVESLGERQYSLMMYNFSLFFGLAVQAYEQTLVSDQTPFDRYTDGDSSALSAEEQTGLALFFGSARCSNCHGGPLFTNAALANAQHQPLERMLLGNGALATYDNGFYNVGVRPTEDDLGVGGLDPFGLPLSNVGLAQLGRFGRDNVGTHPGERTAVRGSFKVPTLRNVALTAPYFHNGGQATLRQVVEFYRRGGDFANRDDIDPDIMPLTLDDADVDALIAFLEALSDERVLYSRAPFDHPELAVPSGVPAGRGADESFIHLDAVGATGGAPQARFLETSH